MAAAEAVYQQRKAMVAGHLGCRPCYAAHVRRGGGGGHPCGGLPGTQRRSAADHLLAIADAMTRVGGAGGGAMFDDVINKFQVGEAGSLWQRPVQL